MSAAAKSAPAHVECICEVRGPDGELKGTFTLRGTTDLSEEDLRSELGLKGLSNVNNSLDAGAERSG